jgi:hypothetical protein
MFLLLSSALACDVANITGPQLMPHSYSLLVIVGGVLAGIAALIFAWVLLRRYCCQKESRSSHSPRLTTIQSTSLSARDIPDPSMTRPLLPNQQDFDEVSSVQGVI